MARKEMNQNIFLISMTICHCLGLASCLTSFDASVHEKSFECESVGRFADPAECSNYYECIPKMEVLFNNSSNGHTSLSPAHKGELVAHSKSCFGNAFHPTHKVCVPTHKVQGCIPRIPQSRSLNMAEPGLQKLCNIEKGNTFVCSNCKTCLTCIDGVAYENPCPFGTVCSENSVFDSAVCYPDYNTECTCNRDQVYKRDYYNEAQFLTCDSEGSEPLIHTCLNELNFNEEHGTCCNGNGTECSPSGPFVVKDNCNKYSTYQSTIGGWVEIEMTCRDKEMFNEDTHTCENPCSWERTFHCETEGRFASPSSCNKYFQCIQDPLNSQKFIEKEYDCPNNSEWKQTLNRNDGQCFIRTGEQKCIPENSKAIKCQVPNEWCQVSSGSPAASPADQCLAEDGVCISTGEECDGSIQIIQKSCLCCIKYKQVSTTTTPTTTTSTTTTTTPVHTTTTTTNTTTPDCPEDFFSAPISHQCLKIFNNTKRTFADANTHCQEQGLALAESEHPIELRSYLMNTLGVTKYTWLGAKGDNSYVRWQSDNQVISGTSSYWYQPGGYSVDSNKCLMLITVPNFMASDPTRPYYTYYCTDKFLTLCELV